MLRHLSIDEWIQAIDLPILDVRSPSEYEHGHIQGACSLPLFNDIERAQLGTTYKQIGKSEALMLGLDLVGPRMKELVQQAMLLAPGHQTRVHCWRGGMRSGSLAWLLHTMGFDTVYTLSGGYKAYRNWAIHQFDKKYNLHVVGGRTGSAKTEVLQVLKSFDQSIVDLEGLAHHKGSAFGWIGQQAQPTQEQFENYLAHQLYQIGNSTFWLEDESERIGLVRIPKPLFEQLRSAQVYFLDIPRAVRIPHLIKTYSHFGDEKLEVSILRIHKRLGGLSTKTALDALSRQDYECVADLMLNYYDKYYEAGVGRRVLCSVIRVSSDTVDPQINAALILDYKLKISHGTHQTYSI